MKIYIDKEYKCHTSNDETLTSYEYDFFDDKCDTFIEGYRYIPKGETWVRTDGITFKGEKAFPWKNFSELDAAQREYEQAKLAQYEQELPQAYLDGVNSI